MELKGGEGPFGGELREGLALIIDGRLDGRDSCKGKRET